MSYSVLYVADKDLNFYSVKEYPNGWGTFPRIWDYYAESWGYLSWFSIAPNTDKFWEGFYNRIGDENAPKSERLIMFSSHYPVLLHKSTWDLLLEGYANLTEALNKENTTYVNHFPEIIKDINSLNDDIEFITIKGTTVDDAYEFRDIENLFQLNDLDNDRFIQTYNSFNIVFLEDDKLIFKKLKDFNNHEKR